MKHALKLRAGFRLFAVLAAIMAATAVLSHGDDAVLQGVVTGEGGVPLAGARIEAGRGSKISEVTSGNDGGYRLAGLTPGSYGVTVSRAGYLTQRKGAVTVTSHQPARLDFRLVVAAETAAISPPEAVISPVVEPDQREPSNVAGDGSTPENDADHHANEPGNAAHDPHSHHPDEGSGGGHDHADHAPEDAGSPHDHEAGGEHGHDHQGAHAEGETGGHGHHHGIREALDATAAELAPEFGDPAEADKSPYRERATGWHGSLSAEYAPFAWNGGGGAVTRPFGLGGRSYSEGSHRANAGFELGGPLFTDKLFIFASYQSLWNTDYYRFGVDPLELVRDEVTDDFANQRFDMGAARTHSYRLQLAWQPHPRHRVELLFFGAPALTRGTLRSVSHRIDPREASGISTQPEPGGMAIIDPAAGASGTARVSDDNIALRYLGTFGSGMAIEASVLRHRRRVDESPGSDTLLYDDYRRKQVYTAFTEFGLPRFVSPAEYFFGGMGRFDAGSGGRSMSYTLKFTHPFRAAGAHELKYGAAFSDRYFRENTLFTGPRGADKGMEIYLRPLPVGELVPSPDLNSVVRLRTGGMVQITCLRPVTVYGTELINSCYRHRYSLIGGAFSPERPDTRGRELNLFAQDSWTVGPLAITFGVRFTRTTLDSPNGYTLRSSRTGNPLIGPDGFPVGSNDPNTPQNQPAPPYRPAAPKYLAGPGEFVGGAYRFPWEAAPRFGVSWDVAGDGRAKLYANYSRLVESVDEDLAMHAFENEFSLFRADFGFPDLTIQTGPASTSSGIAAAIQPGTRLGYKDDFLVGTRLRAGSRWLLELRGRVLNQGRILALTQSNPAEAVANFYFDRLIANGRCLNCAPGQVTLFPGYPRGNSTGYNNPDARGILSETLANPGDNTPSGLFGNPARRVESLALRLEYLPAEGKRWSGDAELRLARASGNYEGSYLRGSGYSHEELSTIFNYPLSPLTRGQYAGGSLPVDTPASLRVHLSLRDLGLKNLDGSLTLRWRRGAIRTPLLALPTSRFRGEVPGLEPDYYLIDADGNSYPDRVILRDYTSAPRGSGGRNPDRVTLDAGLEYRFRLLGGALRLNLRADNLLNERRAAAYDDFLETDLGVTDTAVPGATQGPLHDPATTDPVPRIANPEYRLPTAVEAPRVVRIGLSWSF